MVPQTQWKFFVCFNSLYFQDLWQSLSPPQEPLCSFQLPLARSAHHIKWKQKIPEWNEGNVRAFFLVLLSYSPTFLFGPLITWTPAEGLQQHRDGGQVTRIIAQLRWHHSLELDFNSPAPRPQNRNSCRWDTRVTSCVGLVGNLQVVRVGHYRASFQKCPMTWKRTSQLRWSSQPYRVTFVPGFKGQC